MVEFAKRMFRHNETYLVVIIVVFSIAITSVNPAFLRIDNIMSLLKNSAGTAMLAVGFFMILLTGDVDVSFPAIAISAQYIAVRTLIAINSDSLFLAFAIAITVGLVYGAINAFFVTKFGLQALIVTLGTSNVFHGALLEFVGTEAVNVGELPEAFKIYGTANLFFIPRAGGSAVGFSAFVVVLIGILFVSYLILRFTILGRGIYAIGGDPEAARRAGFNVKRIQRFVFIYAGLLAGIMGVTHISLIFHGNPNYIVDSELLRVIASVVLGGALITGGKGTLTGTMLGVLMIAILEKNLVLLGLSSYWQEFFVGFIIVLGVSITHIQDSIRNRHAVQIVRSQ
ncbi:MAG: ABC transporter permease [Spirochaetaceae bacterium]